MSPASFHGVGVHECSQCHGLWFDRDELRRAKDNTDQELRWLDFDVFAGDGKFTSAPSNRRCPSCSETMQSLEYMHSKVLVDACPADHGIWLEGGEFDRIIQHLEELVDSMDLRDYERTALRELKEIITGPESRVSEIRDFLAVFRLLEKRIGIEHPHAIEALTQLSRRL